MESSAKQRFLEQKRLTPTYELERRRLSDLLPLISAVASVAFMGILLHSIVVAYLSK
jgi:hypothetical protein